MKVKVCSQAHFASDILLGSFKIIMQDHYAIVESCDDRRPYHNAIPIRVHNANIPVHVPCKHHDLRATAQTLG